MNMPRINLYISEADKPIFDEAAEILGEESTSAAIATVLRRAVEAKKAELSGMETVELEIGYGSGKLGDTPDTQNIRFTGKEIAHYRNLHGQTRSGDDRGIDYHLYLTRKGKFLLFVDDWSRWQGEESSSRYEVFDSLNEIEEAVPERLIAEAKEAIGEDATIELDI